MEAIEKPGVVVVMEVTQEGVRTRGRAMAMVAEETREDNSGAVKRRKVGNEKFKSSSSSSTFEQTKSTLDCEIYVKSAMEEDLSDSCNASGSLKSVGLPASCCSSTGSIEKVKVADLEASFETKVAARYKSDESERFTTKDDSNCLLITPTSAFQAESCELESCTAKQSSEIISSCRTVLSPEKMPPEAELEAFFAAAEEDLNKRFKDKYNYDIVNDIPLKGRYDWVQLTPGNED